MQVFAAVMMVAAVAVANPAVADPARGIPAEKVTADLVVAEMGEAYVAELDADWNVSREVRLPCSVKVGCVVNLDLNGNGLAAVHVRFDPLQAGKVDVTSRVEDATGRASPAQAETLALDRTGFGAGHYEVSMLPSGTDGHIIMLAVKVPGWTGAGIGGAAARSDRT